MGEEDPCPMCGDCDDDNEQACEDCVVCVADECMDAAKECHAADGESDACDAVAPEGPCDEFFTELEAACVAACGDGEDADQRLCKKCKKGEKEAKKACDAACDKKGPKRDDDACAVCEMIKEEMENDDK